jgi:uncharacterized protein YjbJ (UPF0337 family)
MSEEFKGKMKEAYGAMTGDEGSGEGAREARAQGQGPTGQRGRHVDGALRRLYKATGPGFLGAPALLNVRGRIDTGSPHVQYYESRQDGEEMRVSVALRSSRGDNRQARRVMVAT